MVADEKQRVAAGPSGAPEQREAVERLLPGSITTVADVTSKVAAVLTAPPGIGQDRGKRVSLQELSDLGFQGSSLFVDGRERTGQGRDHEVEGAGARDHAGL